MARLPLAIPLSETTFEEALRALLSLPGFFCIDTMRPRRISVLSALPAGSFSFAGAFVTADGHTSIENPLSALRRFVSRTSSLPSDPYLPFSGGIAGYVGFEGARAIRGLDPARGFSRHSQCRMGLYHSAVIFDHDEATAKLVATGETLKEAQAALERMAEALSTNRNAEERPGECAAANVEIRTNPDEVRMRNMLADARGWLRSERISRLHLVRHIQRPSSGFDFAEEFLRNSAGGATRAIFTHEGAVYMVSASGTLLAIEGRKLRSELKTSEDHPCRMRQGRAIESEMAACLAELCEGGCVSSRTQASPGAKVSSRVFEGELSHELSGIDALASLLPAYPLTGSPHPKALSFIDMNEDSHRGLYGGAFGTADSAGLSFSAIEGISTAADGATAFTVGLDVTEDTDEEFVMAGFDELIRQSLPRTD